MPVLISNGKIRLATVRTIAVRIGLVCDQRDRSCRHDEFILCRRRFADLSRSVSGILISAGDAAHSNLASFFAVQYAILHHYIAIGAIRQGNTLRQPDLIVGGNVLIRSLFRLKFLNKVRKIIRRPIDFHSGSVCQFCINVFTVRSFRHHQRIICAGDQNAIFAIIRRVDACALCNEDSDTPCQLHCPCSIICPLQNQTGTLLQCQVSVASPDHRYHARFILQQCVLYNNVSSGNLYKAFLKGNIVKNKCLRAIQLQQGTAGTGYFEAFALLGPQNILIRLVQSHCLCGRSTGKIL